MRESRACGDDTNILSHLSQISTLNPFLKNGKTTTNGWREFTRTSSGMYCLNFELCTLAISSLTATELTTAYFCHLDELVV